MTQKIASAILSFTEIDPGQHRSFNEWHRYDHQPELYLVEGVVAGTRLVATPEIQAQRFVYDAALATTQYFGFYLLADPVVQTMQAIGKIGAKMRDQGRWRDRRGPSTLCEVAEMRSSAKVISDPAVMPFRPYRGLYVTVHDPLSGGAVASLDCGYAAHQRAAVSGLLAVPGVAGCWSFRFAGASAVPGMTAQVPVGRMVRVYWLDDEPEAVLPDLTDHTRAAATDSGIGCELVFASAYRQIAAGSNFDWFDGA